MLRELESSRFVLELSAKIIIRLVLLCRVSREAKQDANSLRFIGTAAKIRHKLAKLLSFNANNSAPPPSLTLEEEFLYYAMSWHRKWKRCWGYFYLFKLVSILPFFFQVLILFEVAGKGEPSFPFSPMKMAFGIKKYNAKHKTLLFSALLRL